MLFRSKIIRSKAHDNLDYLEGLKFLTACSPKTFTAVVLNKELGVSTTIVSIEGLSHVARPTVDAYIHPEWAFIFAAADFSRNPSLNTLAICVQCFVDITSDDPKAFGMLRYVPWPIATVLQTEIEFPHLILSNVYSGEYGDIDDWEQAEIRLRNKGVVLQDFCYTDEFPMNDTIGRAGLVSFKNNSLTFDLSMSLQEENAKLASMKLAVFEFVNLIPNLHKEYVLRRLHGLLAIALINIEVPIDLSLQESSDLIDVLIGDNLSYVYADSLNIFSAACWKSDLLGLLSELCLKARFYKFRPQTRSRRRERFSSELIAAQLILDPSKEGLVNLLCVHKVCYGVEVVIPNDLLMELSESELPIVSFSDKTLRFIFVDLDAEVFLQDISDVLGSSDLRDHCCNVLTELVGGDSLPLARRIELCVRLIPLVEKLGSSKFRELKTSLIGMLNSDLSGLANENVWNQLKLPKDAFVA